jgi:hypothetical protein
MSTTMMTSTGALHLRRPATDAIDQASGQLISRYQAIAHAHACEAVVISPLWSAVPSGASSRRDLSQRRPPEARNPGNTNRVGRASSSAPGGKPVTRILKPVTYVLAVLYFLVDALFMAVAKPLSNWIARHLGLRRLGIWIRSLSPYASLALFSVPVMILEPVKPLAAYLAATGQWLAGIVALIVGELLKLVLVERLFSLTRDKLMRIPSFAWAYGKFQGARLWLESTAAWRTIRELSRTARDHLAHVKRALTYRSLSFEGERNRS